ncbi:uncharacterized protein BO97DRAFT_463091 [Aspergillus homomorphus CBS 101889]|uniref:Uncharacterized protein n=1 Tax=Aspergillus homomorphus (strain CBS 101889) TaxID=1450537 RepID=A0A395I554_ASPHC|nr:hypothetical protein BO97DRAFT_463091 [Aspergillus homomorphus CBS 101889]RAL15220.1 hypothetical protein BO97DRAFT_463091 [Aspergillus homomorphus CBS 101889]
MRKNLARPEGVAIERLKRRFSLEAGVPDRLPAGYQLPTLTLVDGYLMAEDEVLLRSTYEPRQRSFHWTRKLSQQELFEHGVVEIYSQATAGRGVIYLSPESEPQKAPSRDQIHPFEARGRSLDPRLASPRATDDNGGEWTTLGEWQMTYDRDPWPADSGNKPEPTDPVDAGTIEDGWWTTQGVDVPGVRFPLIDNLREKINENHGTQLGDFYQVAGQLYSNDENYEDTYDLYTVRWNRAPLIPFVSDTGLDLKKTFDVGFPDLNIDVTIPALFQEMTLKLDDSDYLNEKITGYFFEYDPTKRGNKGNRHLVTGTLNETAAVHACRSKISQAYAAVVRPGQFGTTDDDRLRPASITQNLLTLATPSIRDLMNLGGYDEKSEFFKNKYAPAFICRYVGRTSKYMNQFTTQEMNDLWYWWQGNGKKSLSQSQEYNDINRLSSREAMRRANEEKLEPYLADHPDNWASDLCTYLLQDDRQLQKWLHFPIDNSGNNLINKQCNILDALSPSNNYSEQFFNKIMGMIVDEGLHYSDIEQDEDQDAKYPWLHDSMHDLIVKVLNDDPSISSDVRAALQEQIEEFEKQNNLNQQADAEQRAAAILEKSASFMRELTHWLTYIGKGLQVAFGGASLFKWVGEAFDQVAKKIPLPGANMLKGISSICMVGMMVAMAAVNLWSLVTAWDTMSDPQRADVIIQTIRLVTDAVDKAIDAFKSFQSKPTETAEDELNVETLSERVTEEVMENAETMGEMAEKIAGDENYQVVIADGLHYDGIATPSEGEESFNEDINSTPAEVPPAYEEAANRFNWSGNLLKIFNAILGIGLVVAMSFSLANDWDSLTDPGKVMGVLNVIVQGLTVLLDVINVGSEVGLWAVTGTMSVALPILGAVLAVIGIVLMIVQVLINFFTGTKPPPDPIADFIDDEAHHLISGFDTAPSPQLSYTLSDSTVSAGQVKTLTIKCENKSAGDVTLSNTVITLYSGDDDVCLFRNGADETDNIQLVDDTDPNKSSNGYSYVTPSSTAAAQLPTPARLGTTSTYYEYDLQVAGPPQDTSTKLQQLVVKAGEYIQSIWTAKINQRGDSDDDSVSWIEIVENSLTDRCQVAFMLKRA